NARTPSSAFASSGKMTTTNLFMTTAPCLVDSKSVCKAHATALRSRAARRSRRNGCYGRDSRARFTRSADAAAMPRYLATEPRPAAETSIESRMDIDRLRADTPPCAERVHLNNAGAALMPEPVVRAVREHFELETRIGGYEAEDARRAEIDAAYDAIAGLVGADRRNIAFTESATAAFAQALTSIPFERGDALLTTRNDYVSNQLLFLSFERRLGVRVLRAPDAPEGGVDVDAVDAIMRREALRAVCVTHVPTNSGLVQDVESIGRLCRERNVLYVVDGCQSVGQMPVDVAAIGCD